MACKTSRSGTAIFLLSVVLFFWNCEYFNRPLEPFIEKHIAEVSVESVGFRSMLGTTIPSVSHNDKYLADPGPVLVTIYAVIALDNPANLALDFSLSWESDDSGMTASLGQTDNRRVEVRIERARRGSQIELRLNAKAETNRTFRFSVPAVFNSELTVTLPLSPVTDAGANMPRANWVMQTPWEHPGIDRVVITYWYRNPLGVFTETYGWNESLFFGFGGLTNAYGDNPAGRNFSNTAVMSALDFPVVSAHTPVENYCFFSVAVYDKFGLSASAATPGFFVAKIGSAYYHTLADAVNAAPTGGSAASPTVIELIADIDFPEPGFGTYTLNNKHIKLTVPQNQTKTVRRVTDNTGSFFRVNFGSLTLGGNGTGQLVLDGGAVWTGGTATPPSPAYSASNTGLSANRPLVQSSGALTIAAGAVLQNNQNTVGNYTSGAVSSTGTFTMSGGIIKNNDHTDPANNAGAILYGSGTSNISGGEISGNNRNAIVLRGGTLSLSGGEIKNNDTPIGLQYNPTVNMSGGTIKDNVHGIYIDSGYFNMSGGEISGNDGGGNGRAIDINTWGRPYTDTGPDPERSITLSGSARIDSNNVVMTHDSWPLLITGNLTGTAPVSTITPTDYAAGKRVLAGNLTAANIAKFDLTPDGMTSWTIDSDGKLAP